jgi:hypothetical protein
MEYYLMASVKCPPHRRCGGNFILIQGRSRRRSGSLSRAEAGARLAQIVSVFKLDVVAPMSND